MDFVSKLDYEVELAVVLGRDALHVREEDVGDYIFGYSVANDVSARDVQYRHKQNFLGKSLDTFFAMGPVIVTADEFPCPPALSIRSFVNGELRQNSVTDQVFFNIRHIVSELSQGMTLPAGTILITGTPAGVGMGMDPPCFLKRGDVVTCEIDGIGRISNPIR
ncbi:MULTISPECIES: fumarylacetoacetate hydrolase family protein [Dysosmobacter]|uniref:fumarylacetoacetate hydrolase family protein n=1 Tax=Dysosmobacter sp. TaxID=2591382 RepID=UPI002FD9B658